MKVTLKVHNAHTVKQAKSLFRRSAQRQNLTLRHGQLYTMRYNPGVQPRTEAQEKSWSLFKEANRLATNDFHDPERKAYWQQQLKSQTKYKTARGLAKAHYIALLKAQMSARKADVPASTRLAIRHLTISPLASIPIYNKPSALHDGNPSSLVSNPSSSARTWRHYRNILYYRLSLMQLSTHPS